MKSVCALVVLVSFFSIGCGSTAMPDPNVDAALPPPTWNNFAQGFFTTYCTGCHNASDTLHDFTQFSQIQRDSMLIACGVNPGPTPLTTCTSSSPQPKMFPIGSGPYPSDDARNRLVQWIEAG